MSDEIHPMAVTTGPPYEGEETRHISVFFPDLGNMTITYETRPGNDEKRPVISVDFKVNKIDVIDAYGGDREIR